MLSESDKLSGRICGKLMRFVCCLVIVGTCTVDSHTCATVAARYTITHTCKVAHNCSGPQYTTHRRPASPYRAWLGGARGIHPEPQHATRPVPIPLPTRAGLTPNRNYATTESAPLRPTTAPNYSASALQPIVCCVTEQIFSTSVIGELMCSVIW